MIGSFTRQRCVRAALSPYVGLASRRASHSLRWSSTTTRIQTTPDEAPEQTAAARHLDSATQSVAPTGELEAPFPLSLPDTNYSYKSIAFVDFADCDSDAVAERAPVESNFLDVPLIQPSQTLDPVERSVSKSEAKEARKKNMPQNVKAAARRQKVREAILAGKAEKAKAKAARREREREREKALAEAQGQSKEQEGMGNVNDESGGVEDKDKRKVVVYAVNKGKVDKEEGQVQAIEARDVQGSVGLTAPNVDDQMVDQPEADTTDTGKRVEMSKQGKASEVTAQVNGVDGDKVGDLRGEDKLVLDVDGEEDKVDRAAKVHIVDDTSNLDTRNQVDGAGEENAVEKTDDQVKSSSSDSDHTGDKIDRIGETDKVDKVDETVKDISNTVDEVNPGEKGVVGKLGKVEKEVAVKKVTVPKKKTLSKAAKAKKVDKENTTDTVRVKGVDGELNMGKVETETETETETAEGAETKPVKNLQEMVKADGEHIIEGQTMSTGGIKSSDEILPTPQPSQPTIEMTESSSSPSAIISPSIPSPISEDQSLSSSPPFTSKEPFKAFMPLSPPASLSPAPDVSSSSQSKSVESQQDVQQADSSKAHLLIVSQSSKSLIQSPDPTPESELEPEPEPEPEPSPTLTPIPPSTSSSPQSSLPQLTTPALPPSDTPKTVSPIPAFKKKGSSASAASPSLATPASPSSDSNSTLERGESTVPKSPPAPVVSKKKKIAPSTAPAPKTKTAKPPSPPSTPPPPSTPSNPAPPSPLPHPIAKKKRPAFGLRVFESRPADTPSHSSPPSPLATTNAADSSSHLTSVNDNDNDNDNDNWSQDSSNEFNGDESDAAMEAQSKHAWRLAMKQYDKHAFLAHHIFDSGLAPTRALYYWERPHLVFRPTKLPPLLPILDVALIKEASAVWPHEDSQMLHAWVGDRALDLSLGTVYAPYVIDSGTLATIRNKLTSNRTLSYIAIHYELMSLGELHNSANGQKKAATVFEAWIGAAYLDYKRRDQVGIFIKWTEQLWAPEVWPDVLESNTFGQNIARLELLKSANDNETPSTMPTPSTVSTPSTKSSLISGIRAFFGKGSS